MLRQTAKKAYLGRRPCRVLGRRLYHENVIDHFENPRNVGSFNRDDPNVGTGLVGSPSCGDLMSLQIKVRSDHWHSVQDLWLWLRHPLLSSSVFLSNPLIKGKTIEEVLTIKNAEIAKHLRLPPVKLHCSMLAEDAIKSAVKNFKEKQAKANSGAVGETVVA